jgi:2,4-didehydro-3-deoxy-L-rhamnonate hydrolase
MKLIRYRNEGKVKTGVILNEQYVDTSALAEDYNETFFETNGIERLQQFLSENASNLIILPNDIELDCPVARPSKMVCIGLNYADHAKEIGAATPPEPVIFLKATTAMVGPNDNIIIPKGSQKTDWEVELAVVIGKRASYVEEADAMSYVAGYCLHNDVSERAFQLERNGTWDKGKGCDTFAPIGPFLATPDELGDVDNLRLWLSLNGRMMQEGTTANLIFKIPFLIHYVSQFMTLLPGDIISTGTPAGVGLGMKPNVYLKAGDVVELGIDGLGAARQQVVAYWPL